MFCIFFWGGGGRLHLEQEYNDTSESCRENRDHVLNGKRKVREAEVLYIGQFAGLTRQGVEFQACMIEKSASAKAEPGFEGNS